MKRSESVKKEKGRKEGESHRRSPRRRMSCRNMCLRPASTSACSRGCFVAFCMKSEAGAGGIISNSVSISSSIVAVSSDVGDTLEVFSFPPNRVLHEDESGKGEDGEGATSLMPLLRGREEGGNG